MRLARAMYKRRPVRIAGVPTASMEGFVNMTAGMFYRPKPIYQIAAGKFVNPRSGKIQGPDVLSAFILYT